MAELERALGQLARDLDWPPAPDVTASVMARLDEPRFGRRRPPRPLLRSRRALALAALALLLLAGGAVAAVPGARHAVLDLFGLRGATVERRDRLPTPPPERALDLGTRTTLAGARLGFDPLVPGGLGDPAGVYVRRATPGGELSLTYLARPGLPRTGGSRLGLIVSEFRGDLAPEYVGKLVGTGTTADRLRVGTDRAVWIEGAPHFFFYRGPHGRFVNGSLRLARNVLLVERGDLLIRLEGALARERAIAIARSLR